MQCIIPAGLKGCNISRYSWKCAGLQKAQLQSSKAPTELLEDFISTCGWILALLLPSPKQSVPIFGLDVPLQVSLLGWDPPGSCPASSGDQFAQLAQSPGAFCTLLQAHVYQGQSQSSPFPHLWNALIMQASRQFLLQFPPGVLMLG